MYRYEVDLRDRETGNSVYTVLVTKDYDLAWNVVDQWNRKHLPDYNEEFAPSDYIGTTPNRFVADCYFVEKEEIEYDDIK